MKKRAAILWLSFLACGDEDASSPPPTSEPCFSSSDCQSGAVCFDNECVDLPDGELRGIHVEITPPAAAPYVRTQLLDQTIPVGAGRVRFELTSPTTFDPVSVLDADNRPIAARLSLFGRERVPGRELEATLRVLPERPSAVGLLPGEYDVRVLPDDTARYPGIDVQGWEVRPSASPRPREFVLPRTYRTIRGEVTLRTAGNVKLDGVIVRARSIPSNLPSTSAVTADGGRFEIALPETRDTTFRLSAELPAELQPAWGFDQIVTVPESGSRTVTVRLEETTDAIRGLLRLRIFGRGPAGPEPVSGASITLTASSSVDFRSFRISATTDGQGYAFVRSDQGAEPLALLAASYDLSIDPPPSSPYRRTSTVLPLTTLAPNVPSDKQIELTLRPLVKGSVLSGFGLPVAGAAVQFERLEGGPALVLTTSGEDGLFEARLDPGDHAARISPTAESKRGEVLPASFAIIQVPDRAEHELPALSLEPGTILEGEVAGGVDGAPVPRSEVQLFVTSGGRTFSLGRAATDGSGRFGMIVPRSLAP
jgi:hypothetical protein